MITVYYHISRLKIQASPTTSELSSVKHHQEA
jgi:hypothetical protein